MLELEQVSGGLAVGPLLKGVVSPTRIEVRNLQLWLVRGEHGKVSIGVTPAQRGQEKPEARSIGADLDELLDRLLDVLVAQPRLHWRAILTRSTRGPAASLPRRPTRVRVSLPAERRSIPKT